jgi:ribosome-associated protein
MPTKTKMSCRTASISVPAGGGLIVIVVNEHLAIPESELTFSASRSGGPGGQNVNKVSSRVTLTFDISRSPSLTDDQRRRLLQKLATRINKDGVLRVISQQTRSQEVNRQHAEARFVQLLQNALKRELPRVATKVPQGARQRRLDAKKKRSQTKQFRTGKVWD